MLEVFFHRHRIWHFPAKRHIVWRGYVIMLQWQKRFNYAFVLYSKSIDTPLRGVVMMLFQHPAIPWGKRNP